MILDLPYGVRHYILRVITFLKIANMASLKIAQDNNLLVKQGVKIQHQ